MMGTGLADCMAPDMSRDRSCFVGNEVNKMSSPRERVYGASGYFDQVQAALLSKHDKKQKEGKRRLTGVAAWSPLLLA